MRIISNSQYYTWYPRRWTILLHRSDPGITRGSIERYFKHPPANVQSRSNISRWTKFSSCSSFAIRSRDIGRATKDSIQSRGVTCSRFRYPCITCHLRKYTLRSGRNNRRWFTRVPYANRRSNQTCREKEEKRERYLPNIIRDAEYWNSWSKFWPCSDYELN